MNNKNVEKTGKGRKRKRVLTVLAVILLLVLIAAAIIGLKFQSHIKSAIIFLTTSDEDIQKNIDESKDKQTEMLNNSGFYESKELDEALMSGKITSQEHTEILLGNLTLEQALQKDNSSEENPPDLPVPPDENEKTEDNTEPPEDSGLTQTPPPEEKDEKTETGNTVDDKKTEDSPTVPVTKPDVPKDDGKKDKPEQKPDDSVKPPANNSSDVDKRTAELVTRMYVLKSDYVSQIDGIIASMKAEYTKLPPEQRNLSAKRTIATKYLGTINAMETQCDAQVNAIVTELRQLLKANGRPTDLADSILATYASEKENTKAYYLSTYGD